MLHLKDIWKMKSFWIFIVLMTLIIVGGNTALATNINSLQPKANKQSQAQPEKKLSTQSTSKPTSLSDKSGT